MDHQVFISHSSRDKEVAATICDRFAAEGVACWMAPRDALPGQSFVLSITEAIDDSRLMLVVLSKDASLSEHVISEIGRAIERRVPILPVKVDDSVLSPRLDYFLGKAHWFDASRSPLEAHLDDLVSFVQDLLAGRPAAIPMSAAQHDPKEPVDLEGLHVSATRIKGEVETERESQAQALRPRIFLCYRREDTQGFARGIYESLASKYGHEQVFRDIDSTPAGVRYSTWIESMVGQCSVMIVLIGDAWLSAKDPSGQCRLDLPKDWVRQEIEAALRRDIPIIPVRVQGAPMPSEDKLPPSIADLTGFQSAEITDSRWAFDLGLLTQAIDNLIAETEPFAGPYPA